MRVRPRFQRWENLDPGHGFLEGFEEDEQDDPHDQRHTAEEEEEVGV